MSLYLVITVVNSSNTATDVSGHSKQAQESGANVTSVNRGVLNLSKCKLNLSKLWGVRIFFSKMSISDML